MKFEEKLMRLRKRNAWSQEEFAEKLNVTRQTISKWELGQTIPDTNNLSRISNILGVSVNDLLDENVDPIKDISKDNKDSDKNSRTIKILILIIILILALIGVGLISLNKIFNKITNQVTPKSITEMFEENSLLDIFDQIFNRIDNVSQEINNFDQESFNSNFEVLYYGKTSCQLMNRFIDEVIQSNSKNPNNMISVKYKEIETSDSKELKELKNQFNNNKEYEIYYEYDENGFINKAIIEKETMTEFAKKSFNSNFTSIYYGTEDGFFMSGFIDTIIKSNEENPDNIVVVKYKNMEISDSNEIRNLKQNFKTGTKYEVSYEYDEDGLINKAIIE